MSNIVVITQTPNQIIEVEKTNYIVEEESSGPQGPAGPAGAATLTKVASTNLSGHRVVTTNSLGQLIYADSSNPTHLNRPLYLTTGAISAFAEGTVLQFGTIEEGSWTWDTELPLFLGLNGLLTQIAPSAPDAVFSIEVAQVETATSIYFSPKVPIDIL